MSSSSVSQSLNSVNENVTRNLSIKTNSIKSSSSISSSSEITRKSSHDSNKTSKRQIKTSERLLRTKRVWYLPNIGEISIVDRLKNKPNGVRILIRSWTKKIRQRKHFIFDFIRISSYRAAAEVRTQNSCCMLPKRLKQKLK